MQYSFLWLGDYVILSDVVNPTYLVLQAETNAKY